MAMKDDLLSEFIDFIDDWKYDLVSSDPELKNCSNHLLDPGQLPVQDFKPSKLKIEDTVQQTAAGAAPKNEVDPKLSNGQESLPADFFSSDFLDVPLGNKSNDRIENKDIITSDKRFEENDQGSLRSSLCELQLNSNVLEISPEAAVKYFNAGMHDRKEHTLLRDPRLKKRQCGVSVGTEVAAGLNSSHTAVSKAALNRCKQSMGFKMPLSAADPLPTAIVTASTAVTRPTATVAHPGFQGAMHKPQSPQVTAVRLPEARVKQPVVNGVVQMLQSREAPVTASVVELWKRALQGQCQQANAAPGSPVTMVDQPILQEVAKTLQSSRAPVTGGLSVVTVSQGTRKALPSSMAQRGSLRKSFKAKKALKDMFANKQSGDQDKNAKICWSCGKKLPNKKALHKHIKLEHTKSFRGLQCPVCDWIIVGEQRSRLQKHLKNRHNVMDEQACHLSQKAMVNELQKRVKDKTTKSSQKSPNSNNLGKAAHAPVPEQSLSLDTNTENILLKQLTQANTLLDKANNRCAQQNKHIQKLQEERKCAFDEHRKMWKELKNGSQTNACCGQSNKGKSEKPYYRCCANCTRLNPPSPGPFRSPVNFTR